LCKNLRKIESKKKLPNIEILSQLNVLVYNFLMKYLLQLKFLEYTLNLVSFISNGQNCDLNFRSLSAMGQREVKI
jgi:hypothetical protein